MSLCLSACLLSCLSLFLCLSPCLFLSHPLPLSLSLSFSSFLSLSPTLAPKPVTSYPSTCRSLCHLHCAEYSSGCADDSTEGLHLYRNVQACAGRWQGHVRLGKMLCKQGWRVCNPKDKDALAQLTWLDIFDLAGCYAYNGATRRGHCRKWVGFSVT